MNHYPALSIMARHSNLKNSASFNRIMFEHYRQRYQDCRWKGKWLKTFFAWKRMKQYENKMYDCIVTELLNDLNKESHVAIRFTA